MEIKHTSFNSSKDGIKAMNAVKNLLRNSNFEGRAFPFSHIYSVWEIDEVSTKTFFILGNHYQKALNIFFRLFEENYIEMLV